MEGRQQRRRLAAPDRRDHGQQAHWEALPFDLLERILGLLSLPDRVAACSCCAAWRRMGVERPGLWPALHFETHRTGSRRSELRRLLSLAAWAQRHAGGTRSMAISARVPADAQPAALKGVALAALAAAPSLRHLRLTTNRGFWPAWLPRLVELRELHLCSKEGGLSLTGDLSPLVALTHLALDARQAVTLADSVRLPPGVRRVELGCIRDTLPPQLAQLGGGLRALSVRRGLVSEGVLLTEYEALAALSGLTALELQRASEEEPFLVPPELLALTRLRHLSLAGCDCSRWALHGSDEEMSAALGRMPHLTSLDLSGCLLEELPQALLGGPGPQAAAEPAHAAGSGSEGSEGSEGEDEGEGPRGRGPRLLRLLAHGNQLEAGGHGGGGEGEQQQAQAALELPRTVRQLSLDLHLLLQPPLLRLPPGCRQLALAGSERGAALQAVAAALPALARQLPELRHLLLEAGTIEALETLASQQGGGSQLVLQQVAGRWRPTRLPGQPRPRGTAPDALQQLRQAGVEVLELPEQPRRLAALLDRLAATPP